MSAAKFLDYLAGTGLLDEGILSKLHQKVAKSKKNVSIEVVVKALMDQGHLTRFQATKLVTEYGDLLKSEAKTDPSVKKPPGKKEEELGFAADESLDGQQELDSSPPAHDDADDIVELEDASASSAVGKQASGSPAWQGEEQLAATPAPLDDPLDDALGDPLAADLGAYEEPTSQPSRPSGAPLQLPEAPRSQWDTKLIIGGSLALGILAIAAFGLYFYLRSGSAAEVFEAAESDYNTGAYQNAIEKYEMFLNKYPRHDSASLAWVRTKMAGLRQNEGRPTEAMIYALKELPELKSQPAFNEGRAELASVLPGIAEKFADQSANNSDIKKKTELVESAEKAMQELVLPPDYLSSKLKENPDVKSRIKRIQEKIGNVRRNIDRENTFTATLKEIEDLTDKGQTADAFVARRKLLQSYPGLEDNDALVQAVTNISKKEAELVRVLDSSNTPLTEEEADAEGVKIHLIERNGNGKDVPGVDGQVRCVLAGGAVYGIDVSTGKVSWRRSVGTETTVHPQPISEDPRADALLADGRRNELIRVKSATGELVWRLPVEDAFLTPVFYEGSLLINTRSGKLLEVNPKTGEVTRVVQFPMEISTAIAYDEEQGLLYQVGDHDNVYVVDAETMECQEVLYLGHKEGSVKVPPVYAVGFLLLVENVSSDRSTLHVIAMNDKGLELNEIQSIGLRGNVVVPVHVFERRVLVATDLGAVGVYDVDPNIDPPVQPLGSVNASATKSFVSYPIVYRGQVWVAGKTLAKYRVQPALSKLNRVWIQDDGDTYVAPIQRVEDVLLYARRRQGADAVTISAQSIESEEPYWQTNLGAPAKMSLDRKNNRLRAVATQAGYFALQAGPASNVILQEPSLVQGADASLDFNQLVEFDSGQLVVLGGKQQSQVMVVDSASAPAQPRLVSLVPFGTQSGEAVAFQESLLVPFKEGMIRLFDIQDGQQSVLPFQPRLQPGDQKAWSAPVVDQESPGQFIVLEDGRSLYRIGVKESPQPHLAALQQRTLEEPLLGTIATLGDTVFAVSRQADHDVVVTLQLPGLEDDHKWPLKGRVVWGPQRVNDRVFVVSDQEGLICFDSEWAWWRTSAVLRWQSELSYGHLAGVPLEHAGSYWLASTSGIVWQVDRETGQEIKEPEPVRLQEPLWGNPVVYEKQLWLPGIDGALYVIPLPPAT